MAEPQRHENDYEGEIDPAKARLDLLSAYTLRGRLERDGLLTFYERVPVKHAAAVAEPPEADEKSYYKAPGENAWTVA